RNRDDDARGILLPERGDAGAHRGAGRETVVDEDDRLVSDLREGTIAAILALAPLELGLFDGSDTLDLFFADARDANEILVEHAHAAARDGTHGQLFLPGQA